MSLKRDHVTEWQRKILGEIEDARKEGKPVGQTSNYNGNPNDWEGSVEDYVKGNYAEHKGELGSSRKGPHGSTWASHVGDWATDRFGFGSDFPIPLSDPAAMLDNAKRLATGYATDYVFSFLRKGAIEKVQDRVNQELEHRGFLEFSYPGVVPASDSASHEFRLPFFENPKIQESRSSRYSSHTIINRNEPWRLFTGADAKKINLSIRLTLPHILHFAIAYGNEEMLRFLNGSKYHKDFQYKINEWIDKKTGFQALSVNNESGQPINGPGERTWIPQNIQGLDIGLTGQQKEELFYSYVQHMVDKVRSSVVGSVSQKGASVQAPPIVFLQFGTMYHREPFIVKTYNINYGGEAGFDINTMLPRVMNIQLQLEGYSQLENHPGGLPIDRSTPEGWDTMIGETDE